MSKTKNWIMDMEEQYYDIADKKIKEAEVYDEFVMAMGEHIDLMIPQYDEMEIDDILGEMWYEYTSKFL